MIRSLALLLLAAAAPAGAGPICAPTATVPGFEPGQAPLVEKLGIGRAVEVALKPVDAVRFAVPLTRRQEATSMGGAFPLEVKVAGTYRVLLSGPAWIDLVRDGAPLVSTEHQHGPPCSGVAKIVAFKLEPGRYEVQLSEAETRSITLKIAHEAMIPVQ